MGDGEFVASNQQRLFERGIHVMLSKCIGAGPQGVIRCAVFADHSEGDLDALTDELEALRHRTEA
jgi:hypothetical protein